MLYVVLIRFVTEVLSFVYKDVVENGRLQIVAS